MSYHEERSTHVIEEVPATESHTTVTRRRSGLGMVERAIVYLFGLIQLLLLLRIVLLLVAAREGNDIVAFIYNLSDIFVAPFRGILGINEVAAGQSALDVAAIVALIGWTIIELLIIGLIRVARPTAD
ncbi:hypothetical protein BH23CHL7_BH23CHL7_21470 [soil metagenome]